MVELTDTHCHIHSPDFKLNDDLVIQRANKAGVSRLICVGTDLDDSEKAIEFVRDKPNTWASVGLHPHEAKKYVNDKTAQARFEDLAKLSKVIAIGECGLDYYYEHSPKSDQIKMLKFQLKVAADNNLPVIFHVRSAFDDFWPIYDEYKPKGVIHSFTAGTKVLNKALERGLLVGINGIITFTKDLAQLDAAKNIPAKSLLLETDSPFLSPVPKRNETCEPSFVKYTAEFLANLRNESVESIAKFSTSNAIKLFSLK